AILPLPASCIRASPRGGSLECPSYQLPEQPVPGLPRRCATLWHKSMLFGSHPDPQEGLCRGKNMLAVIFLPRPPSRPAPGFDRDQSPVSGLIAVPADNSGALIYLNDVASFSQQLSARAK